MERRALYHSLRVNWQLDPSLGVEPWQVEDYRKISSDQLFLRLEELGVSLDYARLVALAEFEETPEDFAETLLPDGVEDQETADRIYLLVFELWRRFLSEKQTLSLFCDELDHQIDLYETGESESLEGLGDILARFQTLLEEAQDEGADAKALYDTILMSCAHDVESFLYDFASLQIEERNFSYGQEIVESFLPYAKTRIWFDLLHLQLLADHDPEDALSKIHQLLKEAESLHDLEFDLEFLAYLAQERDEKPFVQLFKRILPTLTIEEDFWDLLSSVEAFFHYRDDEAKEGWVKALRARRFKRSATQDFGMEDPDLQALQKLVQ